jgi:hypothetical protein
MLHSVKESASPGLDRKRLLEELEDKEQYLVKSSRRRLDFVFDLTAEEEEPGCKESLSQPSDYDKSKPEVESMTELLSVAHIAQFSQRNVERCV